MLLVVLATLGFGAVLSYLHALDKVAEEMKASIAVGSRIAGNALDDVEEWTSPQRRMVLLVGDFHGDRHLRAKWVSPDGRLVMQSNPAAPRKQAPGWFEGLIRTEELSAKIELPANFATAGSFYLETDSTNEISEAWEDTLKTLTILTVFCALLMAITQIVLVWALRPLDRLVQAFADMSNRVEPRPVPERGPRDLVKVYKGFNEMAAQLAKTEAQNNRLNEQLSTVQEEERADLARDLHDEVGPFLFTADVDAAAIEAALREGRTEDIPERVSAIRDSIRHMQQHVRDLLARLRAATLVDAGLTDAVEHLVAFWRQRYPDIAFEVIVPDGSFGEIEDTTIFRVIQEALSNAIRHGAPDHIEIFVGADEDTVRVEVFNDGRPLPGAGRRPGFGISGMRERIETLGGRFEVRDRDDGEGVIVAALLPRQPLRAGAAETASERHAIGERAGSQPTGAAQAQDARGAALHERVERETHG